jgi:hypothetical protein
MRHLFLIIFTFIFFNISGQINTLYNNTWISIKTLSCDKTIIYKGKEDFHLKIKFINQTEIGLSFFFDYYTLKDIEEKDNFHFQKFKIRNRNIILENTKFYIDTISQDTLKLKYIADKNCKLIIFLSKDAFDKDVQKSLDKEKIEFINSYYVTELKDTIYKANEKYQPHLNGYNNLNEYLNKNLRLEKTTTKDTCLFSIKFVVNKKAVVQNLTVFNDCNDNEEINSIKESILKSNFKWTPVEIDEKKYITEVSMKFTIIKYK